jgi:hypothetical protein
MVTSGRCERSNLSTARWPPGCVSDGEIEDWTIALASSDECGSGVGVCRGPTAEADMARDAAQGGKLERGPHFFLLSPHRLS